MSTPPPLPYELRDTAWGQAGKRRDGHAIPHLPSDKTPNNRLSLRERIALWGR